MKEISPKEFKKLTWTEQLRYDPVYKKYKKVRRREDCERCGHFTGYYYEEVGVGKPFIFRQVSPTLAVTRQVFLPKIIDDILTPNILIK